MGHTDMRRGMQSLAAMVQHTFSRDPFAGDLWVFRGRSGTLVKIIWHDGIASRRGVSSGPRQRAAWCR
jgi:transposase